MTASSIAARCRPASPPAPAAASDRLARAPSPVSLETVSGLLKGLNAEQKEAVTHGDGPLLVVAGPGTGKTQVITRRIAWLIATKRARPAEIVALTFTDKAADEMQSRVDVLVPYGYADAAVHTFHAFGDRLIREFAFELGLPSDPRVLSRAESVIFLREHLFALGLDRYRPLGDPTRFLGALAGLFSRAKDEDVAPGEYLAYAEELERAARECRASASDERSLEAAEAAEEEAAQQRELAGAFARYQELLAAAGTIDFGDQVGLALRLLREHPRVRQEVQERFRYVLVDEFQDTNPAQLELVALLAGARRNITVVGDDDQSIYTFRGAALSNILGFPSRFAGTRQIVLTRNYRSRAPILDAAYRLIRHNDPARLEARLGVEKRLVPRRRSRRAPAVKHVAFGSVAEEADWVAAQIAGRLARGAHPRDFGILVRANGDAEPFLRSLNMQAIPWRFSGASGLYARPEVRELLAFLRVVADLDSTIDLYAVATAEPYRLGGTDLTALLEYARRRHRSLWAACEELRAQPGVVRLSERAREQIARLREDLEAASEMAHRRPAGEVLYDYLKRSGRLGRLVHAATPEAEEALADVARFFRIVSDQARLLPDQRVPFVARHLQTLIEAGDDPPPAGLDDERDAVSVLTVHKAKGLEFPVVFLVGLAEGRFPSRGRREPLALPEALCRDRCTAAVADEPAFAEERRLCYVAMTRARDELFLTHAEAANGRRARRPSPFVAEALDRPALRPSPPGARSPEAIEVLAALDERASGPVVAAARPAEKLSLSFSQLDDYLSCPLKFRLRHVLGVPVPPHHALVYGNALHQAVAAFHLRQAKGVPMSVEELLDVFREHWSSEGFLSREHEDARFRAGEAALRRFHAAELSSGAKPPLAVEQEFTFTVAGDRIRGRIDRIDRSPEGEVITDYKSSDVRDPAKAKQKARESLQLAIYALAHEARTGELPAAVQLHFLDSGVLGRAEVERLRLDAAREKMRAAADGIRRRAFEPRPDYVNCSYCPYRDICPASTA